MFKGYHHIGLMVENSERSRDFYVAIGGKVIKECPFPFGNVYMVDLGGGAVVEIVPLRKNSDPVQNPRFAHIALECDDVDAAFEICKKAGATYRGEPHDDVLPSTPPTNIRNAFVKGPDGEDIELFMVKE